MPTCAAERAGHTLQPTALVHEAFLRLLRLPPGSVQNRIHFFALAAQAMRRILATTRAGTAPPSAAAAPCACRSSWWRAVRRQRPRATTWPADDLDAALEDLAKLDERQARVVELRFFGGLSIEETAEVLAVSTATVKRDWLVARAWLHRELRGGATE
jgi:RNA polymerase sigma factor (TIGR02999 family)